MTTGNQSFTNFPDVQLPFLPPNTIVPDPVEAKEIFIQYFNRLYEEIAFAVNSKEFDFFEIAISNTPKNIPNVNTFGSYLVCVGGTQSGQPCSIFSLTKTDANVAGTWTEIQTAPGTGSWTPFKLMITATATNFQISHNRTNVTANFSINVMGTM